MLWLGDMTDDGLKFGHTLIGVVGVTRSCCWKALTVCHSVLHHVLLDLMLCCANRPAYGQIFKHGMQSKEIDS